MYDYAADILKLNQRIAALDAENAAQLAELRRIADALGTTEGHSSVDHVLRLKAELAELRKGGEPVA
jgi:hypothetical protein